jgi:hypothetical protein
MSLQQVIEELHIQLIVFDDQNFFGHVLRDPCHSHCGMIGIYDPKPCRIENPARQR